MMTRVSVLIDTGTATCRALATQLHARHLPYLSIQVTDHDRSVRQDNASPYICTWNHSGHLSSLFHPLSNCLPSLAIPFRPSAFTDFRGPRNRNLAVRWTDPQSRRGPLSPFFFSRLSFFVRLFTVFRSLDACINSWHVWSIDFLF